MPPGFLAPDPATAYLQSFFVVRISLSIPPVINDDLFFVTGSIIHLGEMTEVLSTREGFSAQSA
jgi:hypothetical protein